MREGSGIESLEAAGYVPFAAAGDAATGAFYCAECRYGVTVQRTLPMCPMCGGVAWEESTWKPANRRVDRPLQ